MPAPTVDWTLIRITGHLRDFAANELTGTVTFTPNIDHAEDDDNNILIIPSDLTATFVLGVLTDSAAHSYIDIPATDDPDIQPVGWTYRMTITAGTKVLSWDVQIPIAAPAGTLDLTDLTPVVGVGVTTPYVLHTEYDTLVAEVDTLVDEYDRRLDFYRFGAVGDGVADDTVAIQAAFNAVTDAGIGVPAATYQAVPGTFRLTDTVNITRKALIVNGAGVGNPTAYTPNPGKGTTFQWDGSSGGYPFRIVDSQHVTFRDILFQGNTVNPPAAMIRCYNDGASTIGTNAYFRFEGCTFGRFTWSNVTTASGSVAATAGIIFDGTNTNNDQFMIRDCTFDECAVGVDLPNTQSIWGTIQNCFFNHATTAGVRTSASTTLVNAQFNACTKDVQVNSTAKVTCFGHWSEGSTLMADVTSYGAYNVYGGKWLFSANLVTNFATVAGSLLMHGVEVFESSYTGKKLYVHEAAGGVGELNLQACQGLIEAMFDVAAASTGSLRVFVKSGTLSYDTLLTASAVLPTSVVSGGLSIISTTPLAGWPYGSLMVSGETNMPRNLITAQSSIPQTSGTVEFAYFICQRTEDITQMTLQTANTAAATITLIRYGLYTVAANGDLTLVASTANDTALLAATFSRYAKSLSATYKKIQGVYYATAHIVVATTPPTLHSDNAQANSLVANERFLTPRFMAEYTGQTDLPSSVTNASLVASRRAGFMELLP